MEDVIDNTADEILEYLAQSAHVDMLQGLKESIYRSVSKIMISGSTVQTYRHDKKRKLEIQK